MFYKFYKERTKPKAYQANSSKLLENFKKIYRNNEIEFIGPWINAENPHEQFWMTGFKDESHYNEFVNKARENPEYHMMTEEINKHRESVEVTTLIPADN